MKRTTSRTVLAAAILAVTGGLAINTATADVVGIPTFKEFKASTYQDADGQYIVNGDEPVANHKDLHSFYDEMVKPEGGSPDNLIVKAVDGVDVKWTDAQVGNLTYCVSDKFGAKKDGIVAAMTGGADLWEKSSSAVDFVYVPAQDANCTTGNNSVLFSVEPTQTSSYIARAFFPDASKRTRNVLVDDSIWDAGTWTPSNVLGHELGHVLGFRHEHTRPESGTCFEDNDWRPLTPYDSSSIMHYPQCNGASTDLSFTETDGVGVRALYGE